MFIAVDHHNAECVGVHTARQGTRFDPLEPIGQGVCRHFGPFAKSIAAGLSIRHDHGSQYMSTVFQAEIAFRGAESSPAFVRAPDGNGCAERFIHTLKDNVLWVQTFDAVEDLRCALLAFKETYNTTWLIGRPGHRTPAAVRQDLLSPATIAAWDQLRCLQIRGRYITSVFNALEVLTQFRTRRPFDTILMDLQMPVMDGLEATAAIRKHEAGSGLNQIPIVGPTANALTEDAAICLVARAESHQSASYPAAAK